MPALPLTRAVMLAQPGCPGLPTPDGKGRRARIRAADRPARPKNERSAPGKLVEGATVQGWNAAYGALSLAFPGRLDVTL
jgi:hypothetical protein